MGPKSGGPDPAAGPSSASRALFGVRVAVGPGLEALEGTVPSAVANVSDPLARPPRTLGKVTGACDGLDSEHRGLTPVRIGEPGTMTLTNVRARSSPVLRSLTVSTYVPGASRRLRAVPTNGMRFTRPERRVGCVP